MTFESKFDDGYRPEILKVDIEAASADEKKRIYDPASEQIWELSATQAHVWDHADGRRSVAELAGSLCDAGHTSATEQTVWQALAAFDEANLLAKIPDGPMVPPAQLNRRGTLKRLGAGMGLAAAFGFGILGFPRMALASDPPTTTPAPGKKVTICHKGKKTLEVGKPAEPAHLAHGDTLGACNGTTTTTTTSTTDPP
jgi:hypothetical protein